MKKVILILGVYIPAIIDGFLYINGELQNFTFWVLLQSFVVYGTIVWLKD